MRAIDTNIVLRIITDDHPEQTRVARELIESERLVVPTTVVLEAEWALRRVYRYRRSDVLKALRVFLGHPNIELAQESVVAAALDFAERGIELADALHAVSAPECSSIVTFDEDFIRAASRCGDMPVEHP